MFIISLLFVLVVNQNLRLKKAIKSHEMSVVIMKRKQFYLYYFGLAPPGSILTLSQDYNPQLTAKV